jgi:uncharacterized cupredoxin-like copper-binding protein
VVSRRTAGAVSALAAAVLLPACSGARAGTAAPPVRNVDLVAHYSHFSESQITVKRGTILRFVMHNDDPIDHELIVGDQALQDRHELGTEAKHPARPGEMSVPAHSTGATQVSFDQPGTYTFACHLPGHYAYGMHGTITVT